MNNSQNKKMHLLYSVIQLVGCDWIQYDKVVKKPAMLTQLESFSFLSDDCSFSPDPLNEPLFG